MAHPELITLIRLYRELGFFEKAGERSDEELAEELNSRYREVSNTDIDSTDELVDLTLMGSDKDRAWWQDLEGDVFPENNAYVVVFNEWARISRGAFRP